MNEDYNCLLYCFIASLHIDMFNPQRVSTYNKPGYFDEVNTLFTAPLF